MGSGLISTRFYDSAFPREILPAVSVVRVAIACYNFGRDGCLLNACRTRN